MLEYDMSTGLPRLDGEPRWKRVRKGTRSCWECKRRKVRCQLSSEDVPICSGCLSRGTTCLSQEYPEERRPSNGSQVGKRLGRVEQLLETLVAKISAYEEEGAQRMMAPKSVGNDVLTPLATAGPSSADSTPLIAIFGSPVLGRRNNSVFQTPTSQSTSSKTNSCRHPKNERIRQILVDLLPSQTDTDLITKASSSWFLVHTLSSDLMDSPNGDSIVASTVSLAEVSKKHPTSVARALLFIAICLQQLDPDFDQSRLHLSPSLQARMEKIIATVQDLVTSDDELVSTLNGLECLILLGVFHINAGNPRRAWLAFRRALNIGQLMGCHKPEPSLPGAREVWLEISLADRYLALLLGFPAGSEDPGFIPEETFDNPNTNKDLLFSRKLCGLSLRIIERNEAAHTNAYGTTQEIDKDLDALVKSMPASWWAIPDIVENDRSPQAAATFDRLMSQIWFFQLEALLHLPFMLKSERRYDYSKFSCLQASREMMWRYLALRSAANNSFCCKFVDFEALTATVTLFLGLLDSATGLETSERKSDRLLIRAMLKSMEELSRGGKDVVGTQSANVIKSLLAVDDTSGRNTGNLKLTIPYFGTISIIRPHATPQPSTTSPGSVLSYVPQAQGQQHASTMNGHTPPQHWATSHTFTPQNTAQQNPSCLPLVSFTSSQFPPVADQQIEDWGLPAEMDTLLFNSLLNTDLESSWFY